MVSMIAAAALLPQSWTLCVGGDVMLNGISAKSNPMFAVGPILQTADISVLNLEIPLTKATTVTPRKSSGDRKAKRQFVLKADPEHTNHLKSLGVDLVSLGNNHVMDYGVRGLKEMMEHLKKSGIGFAGAGLNQVTAEHPRGFKSKSGVELSLTSFLSFRNDSANNTCWPAESEKPGLAALKFGGDVGPRDRIRVKEIVDRARAEAPFVAIAIHWGIEKETVPSDYQVALGRAFVDAGADIVIGHHPHVLQGAEVYKKKPIFYSLGNFISPRPATSALFTMRFNQASLDSISMAPMRMGGGKLSLIQGKSAVNELQRMRKLSQQVQKRFPSKFSTAPKLTLDGRAFGPKPASKP